jgi:hypothetical protein
MNKQNLKSQIDYKWIGVFYMMKFTTWSNKRNV